MNEIRENKLKEYYENPSICLCCNKVIDVKEGERISYVKQKKFCNLSCSSKYNYKPVIRPKKPKKHCLSCEKELVARNSKYCNNKCQQDYEYKEYIKRWKNGEETGVMGGYGISGYIKRYLFEKYDSKCCDCGWNEVNIHTGNIPLEIDHIDGNYLNNKEDNLRLICPCCHSLTSTYKNGNAGNGRKERAKYYINN